MGGGDKALLPLGAGTLLAHVHARLRHQVARLAISANGDPARFASHLPIVPDPLPDHPGPLAGLLAGLRWAAAEGAETLLTVPTDTPFLPQDLVPRLAAANRIAPIAYASAEGRPHPVVALWPTCLAQPLAAALARGTRAVAAFAEAHGAAPVAFDPAALTNLNTPEDLHRAETRLRVTVAHRLTPRLTLRPPTADDLAFTVALFARPEVVAHRPIPEIDSPEASAARLHRIMARWQDDGFASWVVERDGRPIGYGGVSRRPGAPGLNIAYHLHPDVWGQGLAGEIVAEALTVAFDHLATDVVVGLVRHANPGSRRVLVRAGFVPHDVIEHDGAPIERLLRHP